MNHLKDIYGKPEPKKRNNPIQSLIQVILSQNTNDKNRDRAYRKLASKYSSPREIMEAPKNEVAQTISVAGLHNTKADRMQKALKKIQSERGELELDFLRKMELDQARKWLLQLPGVGPKSAAVILNFDFDKKAFPVDTHVHRVTRRIGLIPEETNRDKAHDLLEEIVPPERMYEFHVNLIRHGRKVCKAPTPICSECNLTDICRYRKKQKNKEK